VLDRTIAIKEMLATDEDSRRRFVREALITARLQHPAIVPVYEAVQLGEGAPFYAMRLVGGRPLSEAIDEAKTLRDRLALVPTVLAVADAVAYAHAERIIHRDLKPANVMMGAFGETVVIDWGLARDLSIDDHDAPDAGPYRAASVDRTVAGTLLGTPAYMPPEQADRREVDERADVYSLGAMLYHVVSGRPPHQGTSRDEVLERVKAGAIMPLLTSERQTPPDLAAIVAKAMAKDARDRYPSARELASDLRDFVAGKLVAVHRYSLRERLRRWAARHRVALIVGVTALAVMLAYGGWSVRRIVEESDRARRRARDAASQRDIAVAQANRAILAQARTLLATDPSESLRLLATMSPDGPGWDAARVIAADAFSRPRVVATAMLRQGAQPPMETSKWTVDPTHGRAFFWSWGWLWIVDTSTGTVRTLSFERHVWTDTMVPCEDGKRLVGWSVSVEGDVRIVELELSRDAPDERMMDLGSAEKLLASCHGDLALAGDPSRVLMRDRRHALAIADDGTLVRSDITTKSDERVGTFAGAELQAASADGRVVVLRRGDVDYMVRVGSAPVQLGPRDARWVVAPDGSWLVAATGQRVVRLHGELANIDDVMLDEPVESLDLSPDGRWLIARGRRTYVWDMPAGAWRHTLGGQASVAAAWVGANLVVTRDSLGTVQVWTLPTPDALVVDPGYPIASSDARWVAYEPEGGVARVDASGGTPEERIPWPVEKPEPIVIDPAGLSRTGDLVVEMNDAVWIWPRGGAWQRLGVAPEAGALIAPQTGWTRSGAAFAWGDHEVVIWEHGRERRIAPFATPATRRLVAVRDDLVLAAAVDTIEGTVLLVDLATRSEVALPGSRGTHLQDRVVFSADGDHLVTGASERGFDGHLVWDVTRLRAHRVERGDAHPEWIQITRDGARAALGGPMGPVVIDVASGNRRDVIAPGRARFLAFDAAGGRLLFGGDEGATLWDIAAGEGRSLTSGDAYVLGIGEHGAIVDVDRGIYRFTDDLPAEPCALRARLGAPCAK
jgi:hypothetical protein